MTAQPEGCGVLEHEQNCLCDVIITKPTTAEYPIIPYQIWNGVALAHYGKWDGTLTHWFELMDVAWTAIHEHRNNQRVAEGFGSLWKRKMPDDVYEMLVDGIRNNIKPTPLVKAIFEKHEYKVHNSYVVHLKKRLIKRGEL